MLYNEKLKPILNDLEDKEIELAGGSVVGMILSITNSLIKYICNLTIGKKKYEEVQEEVLNIKQEAENLKTQTLEIIDQDKQVLEEILKAYKQRKENIEKLEQVNRNAVEFGLQVSKKALETLKLADRIEKVGNKMLASDFKICKYYAYASFESSIVNIEINLESIKDEKYIEKVKKEYESYKREARKIINL